MSTPNTNPKTCERKVKYLTRRHAKAEVKRLRKANDLWRVHVFSCELCGHWHIGKVRNTNRGGLVQEAPKPRPEAA